MSALQRNIGLTMAIFAACLAVVTLMGHRLHTEEVVLQTQTADGWAYYQAKNTRSQMYAADAKLAGLAGRQAALVADNIMKMVNGGDDLAMYEPFGTAIMVPIGPEGGSGQLPGQEELTSREMVASVKGRDLMVDRYQEFFDSTTSVSN